jgi:hypothetical protein
MCPANCTNLRPTTTYLSRSSMVRDSLGAGRGLSTDRRDGKIRRREGSVHGDGGVVGGGGVASGGRLRATAPARPATGRLQQTPSAVFGPFKLGFVPSTTQRRTGLARYFFFQTPLPHFFYSESPRACRHSAEAVALWQAGTGSRQRRSMGHGPGPTRTPVRIHQRGARCGATLRAPLAAFITVSVRKRKSQLSSLRLHHPAHWQARILRRSPCLLIRRTAATNELKFKSSSSKEIYTQ